jgi:hypothetical protein
VALLLQWLPAPAITATAETTHIKGNSRRLLSSYADDMQTTSRSWTRAGPHTLYTARESERTRQSFADAVDATNRPWVAYVGAVEGAVKAALHIRRFSPVGLPGRKSAPTACRGAREKITTLRLQASSWSLMHRCVDEQQGMGGSAQVHVAVQWLYSGTFGGMSSATNLW